MSRHVKQVIVMRTDLGMRKGKMVAQGAHAAIQALEETENKNGSPLVLDTWEDHGTTKICVGVDDEDELIGVLSHAGKLGLPVALITDSGRTEFHDVPTKTCLAIGPWWSDEIDKVTGHLRLI